MELIFFIEFKMKKFLLLTIVTILFLNFSEALIIKVPAYTTECITEKVDADTTLSGSFEVGAGGEMQINVKVYKFCTFIQVTDESGKEIYNKQQATGDRFEITVKAADYTLCFDNHISDNYEKTITFSFYHGEGFSHKEFAKKGIFYF